MKAKTNRAQFVALAKKYDGITVEDVLAVDMDGDFIGMIAARQLTGFGACESCSLCMGKTSCHDGCLWSIIGDGRTYACINDGWHDVKTAKTPEKLVAAFKARAKELRAAVRKYDANRKGKKRQP